MSLSQGDLFDESDGDSQEDNVYVEADSQTVFYTRTKSFVIGRKNWLCVSRRRHYEVELITA
ncbi:hypothetical protein [Marinomonas sp. IMCC 4694]|uniref:hypothetical protein n=1 Tax=Marinomonas sp. IMCC 4694 TaxID=2605432 RepID=UPI0011E826B0|nr:hypothetical protein [Marinomonas sp. IMCC 4694]TYL47324.1 hypothetical protein FXV75_04790 [Marinomonas sp. IMCC 4694]